MIKLLKKSEIDTAKAQDRQREINEGIKLASRVDALRKTQAEEEANLEKFRREAVSVINQEIIEKTKERDLLSTEVSNLEDRRRDALKPLTEKWDEIRNKQDELTLYALDLNGQKQDFEQVKEEFQIEVDLLNEEKKRVANERDESISELAKADENYRESVKVLNEAQKIKETATEVKKSVMKELKERNAQTASKERDLDNRESLLHKKEKELNKLSIKLLDQRATLERAFARLKRKK